MLQVEKGDTGVQGRTQRIPFFYFFLKKVKSVHNT